ncbi:MAG TPA: YitT family protein, partial [Ruminococcaceae bacterium]|nr:YitT family protein [Oscillospiraceae bacterium]
PFILNIPLLILSFIFLGRKSTVNTLKTITILTVILDILFVNVPVYKGDRILSSLFGGVCIGIGLAVIFMRGSTTGGTDIASRLIQLKFPYMQIGRVIFIIDFAVLVLSAVVYKDIEAALYGMVIIFTSTTMLDSVLYGVDKGKMAIIISCEWQSICEKITQTMQRGATILKASGAFSNEEKNVILCAVRKNQFFKLKKIVYESDPKAFIIVSDAGEILGEGFKPLNKTN